MILERFVRSMNPREIFNFCVEDLFAKGESGD